ncbi:MAG: MarR family transcriptional regulator [Gammaproteobacteria bacterium]|nr:MarR family transcriptional regulator [Gammaproteobacteria bacterium]
MEDQVDLLLGQWARERPELDASSLGIVLRIQFLAKLFQRGAEAALGGLGLRLWEYEVLAALRRQGPPCQLPVTALARMTMLSSGAMTTRIDRLEARGLVLRTADPGDRRGINVSLSSEGRELVDRAIEARLAAADDQLGMLSANERRAAAVVLRRLLLRRGARRRLRTRRPSAS